ncbi:hypothetical protein DM01DRAFT_1349585 [Hesseltinella vesiculosa]|uniref:Uncharacterized protein n=1 Tax=Hesseltinella vesiculosa TaxID=101127 RepID=A0A1X2G4W8_9FUNG|nr:hypothetical protein DM01DRAFT_1349585 [Hesseltinella vesiculosa]
MGNTEKVMFAASDTSSCKQLEEIGTAATSMVLTPTADIVHEWYPNQPYLYPLQHMDPHSRYEVRVSYPATTPTDIEVELVCARDSNLVYGVLFKQTYAGVTNRVGMENPNVPVHIVMEPLILGIVHTGIRNVALMIVFALGLGTCVIYPYVSSLLQIDKKQD